jgi:succinyl-diaminopimelate desuccinylase
VVGEGDGWDTDPYVPVLKEDDCLYGRGTDDDKGPLVAALYAMRAVRELCIPLKYNVRLILGTDEESGSGCIAHYFKTQKSAPYTFSPDASFPVYNVEKGSYQPFFSKTLTPSDALPQVVSFHGGFRINVLPSDASAVVAGMTAAEVDAICREAVTATGAAFSVCDVEGGAEIRVSGVQTHASTPEQGNNGVTLLLEALCRLPLADCDSTATLRALNRLFPHGDDLGRALGVAQEDAISGPLTLAFTILDLENGQLDGRFDSRVSVCANEENCARVAVAALGEVGFAVRGSMNPAHCTDGNGEFVQTLLRCYEEYTGRKGECCAMGGGTYVHHIEGGVAFGAHMPDFDTRLHGANERMHVEDMLTACKIFAQVICDLCAE